MRTIDLNCDMGESFGAYKIGRDREILSFVSSANIACGFHAGDPSVMRKTVQLALEKGAAIGAHPGLPDLSGFGRRPMALSPTEAYELTVYQIGALQAFVKAEGGTMQHVKPHGAFYNMAASDPQLAEAIAEAVYAVSPDLMLFGLSGSELIRAGQKTGLRTVSEVFADRTYQADGTLTVRSETGALITDKSIAAQQVLRMVKEQRVRSIDGQDVPITAETVCLHGDKPAALEFATEIRQLLEKEGITVSAAGHPGT